MFMPPVSQYLTRTPYDFSVAKPLSSSCELMGHHETRHLIVLDDGEVLRRSRDDGRNIAPNTDKAVLASSSRGMAVVHTDAPIDEVLAVMENGHFGSVIVVGPDGIEGVFTLIDAVHALCDVLRNHRPCQ